jgi:hypothetical protein
MARRIAVEIVGDASSLERAFKKSAKAGQRFDSSMDRTARRGRSTFGSLTRGVAGLAGGFVGAYGLTSVAKAAFGEMAEAQKVTAQTNAVLKSTGRVAGVSAKHVDKLATSLLNVSGTDDEIIKQGENMLLTFRDIRNATGRGNKIFDEATKAALDMSVATGTDMTQSALRLGKALNDPIKGVGSLARVGVQFTEGQKDQIKALTESGQKMEAQKIILRELNKEFGGSAKAAGQTLPGKLNILRNTLLNLAGSIASTLTPAITKLVDKMVSWLSKSKNQKQVLDTVKAAAAAVESVVRVLTGAFQALNAITGSTKNTFKLLLAGFVAFKALKLVSYIAGMAKAMRGLAVASALAGGGGKAGLMTGRAGPVVAAAATGYFGAKALGADRLGKFLGGKAFDLTHRGDTSIHIDGHEIARLTARHHEVQLARRRKQRAHARRSTR